MEINKTEYYFLQKEVANGNEDAFDYLMMMSKVFRSWDDLYDRDQEVSKETANEVFSALCFDLSRNKFFKENREVLEGFVFSAWNAWMDSNLWRGHEDRLKGVCAWFIRDYCNELDSLVAWLVGGLDHARKMSLKCREFYLKQLVQRGTDNFFKD